MATNMVGQRRDAWADRCQPTLRGGAGREQIFWPWIMVFPQPVNNGIDCGSRNRAEEQGPVAHRNHGVPYCSEAIVSPAVGVFLTSDYSFSVPPDMQGMAETGDSE